MCTYAVIVAIGMAIACFALATTPAAWALIAMIFLLRQFGQGLCQHTAVTGMVTLDRAAVAAVAILDFQRDALSCRSWP